MIEGTEILQLFYLNNESWEEKRGKGTLEQWKLGRRKRGKEARERSWNITTIFSE